MPVRRAASRAAGKPRSIVHGPHGTPRIQPPIRASRRAATSNRSAAEAAPSEAAVGSAVARRAPGRPTIRQ
ncbi:hypothetical protein GCM10009613_57440 [Pseudonocardia kongjuensis]|uniref:Uncharacterized protein n=1 Tax=Pseudonocardia kongjuensis TaxID=102227 RepID=A0ABN1Y813_9PSEU